MEKKFEPGVLHVTNLQASRDFVDVRDAVRAYHILLLQGTPGHTYDICSGKERTLAEVLDIYKSLAAVNFRIEEEENKKTEALKASEPDQLKKLAWDPAISFDESLRDILAYYREEK
jgi:GDP-4-dehydro-6-deoxy-D-mannose reductase